MKKLIFAVVMSCCLLAAHAADTTPQQKRIAAAKRLKYVKYVAYTNDYEEKTKNILSVATREERKYYDDFIKYYKDHGLSVDEETKAGALTALIEKMQKNDLKTLAELDQLKNDIKNLQGNDAQPERPEPPEPTAAQKAATAKAECDKLQNYYNKVKYDYSRFSKITANNGSSGLLENVSLEKATNGLRDIEDKFDLLPASTPEAQKLKVKLLQQLKSQLGKLGGLKTGGKRDITSF